MFKISPRTRVHFIWSHLMRSLPMTDTKANIHNMLSWPFSCLNPAFSHISHHKKKNSSAIMLLSLSTFLSSFPNSLPKEKGTSNASVCPPPSTLTDLTTDVSALDHRGKKEKKLDLQTHCLWHLETTRGKDTSEMEWGAFHQPSLVPLMRSTRQSRETAAGSALEQLQGFFKGKGGSG